jgi:hypothetical protein
VTSALTLAAHASVLAGENQKSGPIGLAVILVLCVVSYLLFKSMSKHMRKVREEFPDGSDGSGGTAAPPEPAAPTASDEPSRAATDRADDARTPEEDVPG